MAGSHLMLAVPTLGIYLDTSFCTMLGFQVSSMAKGNDWEGG
jgi:hypothetical protein